MCRLILAKGEFSSARLLDAAVAMSCGLTAEHEGPIKRHPNGWGAIWRQGGELVVHRDTRPIEESWHESPIRELQTDFLAIHVRHATLEKNHGMRFTHPLRHDGERPWFLLHNGFLPTIYKLLGKERSEFDSQEYLEFLMRQAALQLDLSETSSKLAEIPPGGSSANAFLVTDDRAYVIHWTPADNPYPNYFTMHRLESSQGVIFASEVIDALGPRDRWQPLPARHIVEVPLI